MEPRHPRSTYKLKVPILAESSVSLHSSISDDSRVSTDATGLDPFQKKMIKDSWKRVRKDLTVNGRNLFIELFSVYPQYKSFFSELKKIPVTELKESKAINAHSNIVMYSLSAMIEHGLDDPEVLQVQLVKMARTHARKKIKEVHFQNFSGVFMTFLRKLLGREMTTPLENSWNSFLDKMGSIVKTIQDNETND